MINRHRLRPPYSGTHIAPVSDAADTHVGAVNPAVGAFIAGPIGALIGRVLAGTIEAVTSSKATLPPAKKKRPSKKSGPASTPFSKLKHSSESPTPASGSKLPRKRRTKKR